EAPNGVEWFFVLQPAVQQLAAQLVPAVSAKMGVGVEFAEQPRTSVTADLYAQRSGARRAGEPERLDVLDLDPKLVVQRPADRRSTGAADIQVGAASPPVDDRKGLAR